jgi:hypothetical protein
MEELGLSFTNENSKNMLAYNNKQQATIGEIKDVTLVLCDHREIYTTCNIQVINMHVSNYSIILGQDWQALTSGYMSMDGTHMSLPKVGKNIIVLCEGLISPYIERILQPHANYIEYDNGVYYIFIKEESFVALSVDPNGHIWHMHFDGACSGEGKGVGIVLYSPSGKIHNFAYRLEFACTNNVA